MYEPTREYKMFPLQDVLLHQPPPSPPSPPSKAPDHRPLHIAGSMFTNPSDQVKFCPTATFITHSTLFIFKS